MTAIEELRAEIQKSPASAGAQVQVTNLIGANDDAASCEEVSDEAIIARELASKESDSESEDGESLSDSGDTLLPHTAARLTSTKRTECVLTKGISEL